MRKQVLVPILLVAAGLGTLAMSRELGWEGALLSTGWVLLVIVLLSAAVYRIMLVHYDRAIRAEGAAEDHPLRRWFHHREEQVDHLGIILTIVGVLYTAAISLYLVSQIIDTTLRKIMSPFAVR